jgi:hypothetical protein
MDNTPYAPPRAPVADVIPGLPMPRPWQVRAALVLCWLIPVFTFPELADDLFTSVPGDAQETSFFVFLAGFVIVAFALLGLLYMLLARGYRWARIVFAVFSLLDLISRVKSAPEGFAQAWYLGVLNIVVMLLSVAALCLLFTGPANAWFRTRGGRIEAP